MAIDVGKAIAGLKEIVDEKSPKYLTDEPCAVYRKLIDCCAADTQMAGAILYFLVSDLTEEARNGTGHETLSKTIRKQCCFNKEMSDALATIFLTLFSADNKQAWKDKDLEGWKQFLKDEFPFSWRGFSKWDYGTGTVSCHYEAEITVRPTEHVEIDSVLAKALKRNPFMTKGEIAEHYIKIIKDYLANDFESYCTEDDYYQPVVEDYFGEDNLKWWCEKNGFRLVKFDGNGWDDGYEPKLWNGGW